MSNQPNREENEISLLQDGKQGDDMMMTKNRWPLVMMWSKMAPKGTKRAKVASTTMMGQPHIMANPKEKMKVADLATKMMTRTALTN